MNNNKSLLLKISVIMNTVLAFFGSYIGNLYIIQIIALIPAFLAVPLKEIKKGHRNVVDCCCNIFSFSSNIK